MNSFLALATVAASYLRTLSPRARTRILDADDIVQALEEHAAVVAANPGTVVRTRLLGGYVTNGYGFGAESDRVEIETDAVGRMTWRVSRTHAEAKAFGRGDTLRTWTLTSGGAMQRAA